MDKFKNRFKRDIQRLCETLEMAVAVLVLLGIVITIVSLVSDFEIFRLMLEDITEFKPFLEEIFVIVIGIEFLQMLCRPNSDNVMEVLIFLVARHMIVGDTTAFEDFISVISVGLLCVLRRYLHVTKEKEREREQERNRAQEKIMPQEQVRESAQQMKRSQEQEKTDMLMSMQETGQGEEQIGTDVQERAGGAASVREKAVSVIGAAISGKNR